MYGHFDKVAIDTACHDMYAKLHNNGVKGSVNDMRRRISYARFGKWQGLVEMWMDMLMRRNQLMQLSRGVLM